MSQIDKWEAKRKRKSRRKSGPPHQKPNVPLTPAPNLPDSITVGDLRVEGDLDLSYFDSLEPDQGFMVNPTGATQDQVYTVQVDDQTGAIQVQATDAATIAVTSDGATPLTSPTPTVQGGPGYIAVKWDAISNADPVTYEVHISLSTGFTPDSSTLVGEQDGTVLFIRQMPDDSSLDYDTDYFVKIVAKDADGSADASTEASSQLVRVQQGELAVEAVTAENILSGSITAEKFDAVLLLASLIRTAAAGQRIEIDGSGIRAFDSAENLTVNLPTSSGSPSFKGTVEATGLNITGEAVLSGQHLTLNQDTELLLSSALSNPVTPPTVTSTWEEFDFDEEIPSTGGTRKGMTYVPDGDTTEDTPTWLFVTYKGGGTVVETRVSDGVRLREKTLNVLNYPITAYKRGSYLYIFCLHWTGTQYDARLQKYNWNDWSSEGNSGALFTPPAGTSSFQVDGSGIVTIGATDYFVILRTASTSMEMRFHQWSSTDGSFPNTSTAAVHSGLDLGEHRFLIDIGDGTWYTCEGSGENGTVKGWTAPASVANPPTRDSDKDFIGAADGCGWDGTSFWSPYHRLAKIRKHSDWYWDGETTKTAWVRYTWFNDVDTNGRDAGDYESAPSPAGSVSLLKRSRLVVTLPSPPNASDVTHVPVYADLGDTEPTLDLQADTVADYPNTTTVIYTDIAAGAAPPASSNFPNSGTPGLISFGDGTPLIVGDNRLILPNLSSAQRDAVSGPESGLIIFNTDKDRHQVYDGGGWNTPSPAGVLLPFAGATTPDGWLLCSGQAVSRTTYAALFAAIGETYGAGDGSTTFNVPDLRGRTVIGLDNMGGTSANRVTDVDADALGGADGAETHTLTTGQLPSHTHGAGSYKAHGNQTTNADITGSSTIIRNMSDSGSGGEEGAVTGTSGSAGSDNPHNNMQPYMALNYIIKY